MSLCKILRPLSWTPLYAAALGVLAACPVQAGLIGDSVTGNLTASAGGWGVVTQQFASPATVGAGLEFSGQWKYAPGGVTSEVWDITVDIDATSITVSAHENTTGSNNLKAYNGTLFGITLGGLDLGSAITGLSLVSGQSTWSNYDVFTASTTASGIAINWHNLDFGSGDFPPNGGSWTWAIQTADVPPAQGVPEPASAALVLAGLLATAAARRRRRA